MKHISKTLIAAMVISTIALSGCGSSTTTSSPSSSSTSGTTSNQKTADTTNKTTSAQKFVGADSYQGKDNLAKFEKNAQSNPSDAKAQISAGISANVNGDYQKAITYYKKAISDDPKNVVAYNNLGNVYYRSLNSPKDALQYYQKATEVDPTYVYGWWNLALCENSLGDKAKAKDAVNTGLQKVPTSDPQYNNLKSVLSLIK